MLQHSRTGTLKGKPTCEIGKVLLVLNTLGIDIKLAGREENTMSKR